MLLAVELSLVRGTIVTRYHYLKWHHCMHSTTWVSRYHDNFLEEIAPNFHIGHRVINAIPSLFGGELLLLRSFAPPASSFSLSIAGGNGQLQISARSGVF